MLQKKVYIFTKFGLGDTQNKDLQICLAKKFLALVIQVEPLPTQMCFYTDGVKLCTQGSPVLGELKALEAKGVELVLCATCLETFGLTDQVEVGIVGGMGDIITAMTNADNVITL